MNRIKNLLAKAAKALGATEAALAIERHEVERLRKAAQKNERRAHEAAQEADRLRAAGHMRKANAASKRHDRRHLKAEKLHQTKQQHIGNIKQMIQKRDGLAHKVEDYQAELRRLEGRAEIHGNKVVGGDPEDRLRVCMAASATACASGRRYNRYSQSGYHDLDHCIEGIGHGARDDCSSWGTSVAKSCGLPDPNGTDYTGADWTGSAEAHLRGIGHEVSEEYAMHHPCIELFGPVGQTHHWEWTKGNGTQSTDGHGSAQVDEGTFHMLGGEVHFYKPQLG